MVPLSREERCIVNIVCWVLFIAAYHLNSKVPIDWKTDSTQDTHKSPFQSNKEQEQLYMQYLYNQRMTRKMIEKYHSNFDTFRVIPNEQTLQRDRDILTQQL